MREIIVSVAVVILVICLGIFYSCEAKKNAEQKEIRDMIETKIGDFRREKKEVVEELEKLEAEHHRETVGASRLMLVFTSLDRAFTEEIYPLLRERSVVGTLCLDSENLPGVYSYFTNDDLNLLVSEGWQTAVFFDGIRAVNGWYVLLEEAFSNAQIEIPEVVVVDTSNYTEEIEASLLALGFKDVIVMLDKPDIAREDVEDKMRITDAVGWYTTVASNLIDTFAAKTGDAAFIIGGENIKTKYEESQFSSMLMTLLKSVEKEQIVLTTPKEAGAYRKRLREAYERTITEHTEKIKELKERINALDEKIESVYDEYIEK